MRRVRDANPDHVTADAEGELFRVWRHQWKAGHTGTTPLPADHNTTHKIK